MSATPLSPVADQGALHVLAALLEARTGQRIAANRAWRIESALRPILVAEGLSTIEALVGRLLSGSDNAIGDRIVDALLNQETSFFRDAGILEAAGAAIATVIAERDGAGAQVWSAGCSTGQEPLSLAMCFAEANEAGRGPIPQIIATDVSDGALARGRSGRFTQFEIQRGLAVRRMVRWFDSDGGDWIAHRDLLKLVSFRRHNLTADPPPMGPFDAVLCRNVLFYLSPALRVRVLEGIATVLRPGGLLVLGAGETVIGQTDCLRPSRRFRGLYELAPAENDARRASG